MTDSQSPKRLYRSGKNHVLAGVCAGVAEYLNTDPLLVRLLWFLTIFLNGLGLIAYFICMIAIPLNPEHAALPPSERKKSGHIGLYVGIALVLFGALILFDNIVDYHWFWFDHFWFGYWPFSWRFIWPILIIAFGVWYIIYSQQKGTRQHEDKSTPNASGERPRLLRDKSNRLISGVCSGLANHFNIDVTLVRIGYVLFTLFTHVILGVGIYIAIVLLVPVKENSIPPANTEEQAQ